MINCCRSAQLLNKLLLVSFFWKVLTIYMSDIMKIMEKTFHENIQLVCHFISHAVIFHNSWVGGILAIKIRENEDPKLCQKNELITSHCNNNPPSLWPTLSFSRSICYSMKFFEHIHSLLHTTRDLKINPNISAQNSSLHHNLLDGLDADCIPL